MHAPADFRMTQLTTAIFDQYIKPILSLLPSQESRL
ncbi:hypothetical protein J2848_002399 [Azospirillum lipoferum]|nr:hypothetical protein [Azospirillum lipoferum]